MTIRNLGELRHALVSMPDDTPVMIRGEVAYMEVLIFLPLRSADEVEYSEAS